MPDSLPFVSVVIPAYNAERWIGETLASFAAQSADAYEVIVVDDGSSDATADVAETFRDRLELKVVREPRSGAPAHPCNVGTRLARGELVVCCDADDLAVPERIQATCAAWDAAGRRDCLIFSDHAEIDEGGVLLNASKLVEHPSLDRAPVELLRDGVALMSAEAAFEALLAGCFIRPCAVAVPRRVVEEVGGYDERLRNGQDYDLYLRVGHRYPFVWIKQSLGLYRRAATSISARPLRQLVPSRLLVLQRLLSLALSQEQGRKVHDQIAMNYQALGYECGNRGELVESLRAYLRAFRHRADPLLLRAMAGSVAKKVLAGHRPSQ